MIQLQGDIQLIVRYLMSLLFILRSQNTTLVFSPTIIYLVLNFK